LRRSYKMWLIVGTVLANVGLLFWPSRYASAFVLLWVLPGLAWSGFLSDEKKRVDSEALITGLGLGMASIVVLTLVLHYLPGPLTVWLFLPLVDALIVGLVLLGPHTAIQLDRSILLPLLIVILIACLFRVANLGYSEFQGDEGVVMMRAARGIEGDDEQLFYHQKGPAEVLVPMATWTLSGTINEWQARLPFSFAGVLGVLGVFLTGTRLCNQRCGLVGALLLAINGYFVGFGRIVQYQSLVLALTVLSVLSLWRWSEVGKNRWLLVGSTLLASSLLGHYDAGMVIPAAGFLVVRYLWIHRKQWRLWISDVVLAATMATALLLLFYLPFFLHPNFSETVRYLAGDRLGEGVLYNNLITSMPLATFYNSTYYLIGVGALLIVASLLPFRKTYIAPVTIYVVAIIAPDRWVAPVLATLMILILLMYRTTTQERVLWLWFGVPFLFYYFLVWDARTHILNVFPAAVLIAGMTLDRFLGYIRRRTKKIVYGVLVVLYIFLAWYPYWMFVQHTPEVKRTWPSDCPQLYWRPSEMPLFGYFGFPYRAGWNVVDDLIDQEVLTGTYASNEEPEVTNWYANGLERTYCPGSDWYFIAENVQDEVSISTTEIEDDYHLWGQIIVKGDAKLRLYKKGEGQESPIDFDSRSWLSHPLAGLRTDEVLPPEPSICIPTEYTFGGKIRLLGYCMDSSDARPGGSLRLTLYWEALQPIVHNYQVFNHLYDGTMWGQKDSAPACAMQPTSLWEPGRVVRDEHEIPVRVDTSSGSVPLLVGMYNLNTEERLWVADADGEKVGDAVELDRVIIQ